MIINNGVCIILQARLNSKRLPKKALLKLGDKTILEHALNSLSQIFAQYFILACDHNSYESFLPIAEKYNFITVAGSEEDVLSRFVLAVERANKYSAENNRPAVNCVVRATADNPFLFVSAINDSIERYFQLNSPDYFTLTGLPVGSGVEIINPNAILKANKESVSAYEREHVGPAIYHHKDKFKIVYETANKKYYYPELRTTVDTPEDFSRSQYAIKFLCEKKIKLPASAEQIIEATFYAKSIIVFVPSVTPGNGSGHLRRVIELATNLQKKYRTQIFLSANNKPDFVTKLLEGVNPELITNSLPKKAKLIVLDNFQTDKKEVDVFKLIAPVIALDEGGSARANADYLLDIIPRLKTEEQFIAPNLQDIAFIPLPKNRKNKSIKKRFFARSRALKVLVSCGGEDNLNMALPIGLALNKFNFDVTVISPKTSFSKIQELKGKIKLLYTVPNLREELYNFDLVITIFGFTAFEALAAGCLVALVSPTNYHYKLGLQNGFSTLPPGVPTFETLEDFFSYGVKIPKFITPKTTQKSLVNQISKLYNSKHFQCPVCEHEDYSMKEHKTVCRLPDRTISQCKKTGLYFLSFISSEEKKYNQDYFFEEYKKQYGKTYLEDFPNIMAQGVERLKTIEECYIKYLEIDKDSSQSNKKLLDIGCAYGAFLKVCEPTNWFAVGTDISESAVNYVTNELNLPAFCSAFPALPESFCYKKKSLQEKNEGTIELKFELKNNSFQAITMWFVIEHFPDLTLVLKQVSNLLVDGGIFAFSTPTLSGISGKQNRNEFFANSPTDHYSIFDFESVEKVLDKFGFKVVKIVSVGHHPERFKNFSKIKSGGLIYKILDNFSKKKKLGDTMEVYAVKRIRV